MHRQHIARILQEIQTANACNGKSLAVSNDAQSHFERCVIRIRAAIVSTNRSAKPNTEHSEQLNE